MSLKLDSPNGEIKNLKFRKEGSGEEGSVPLDITISCMTNGKVLKTLIGSDNCATFWRTGQDKELMYPGLGKCESINKFKFCQMDIGGVQLKNVDISKFKFTLLPGGQVELDFNAAARELSEHEISQLRDLLKRVVPIKCTGGDLVDMMEDDPEEEDDDNEELDFDAEKNLETADAVKEALDANQEE